MAYQEPVAVSSITPDGDPGEVPMINTGGTATAWALPYGSILGTSGSVTLANNATTTITHAAVSRPIIVTGEREGAAVGPTALLHLDGANNATTIDDTGTNGGSHSWSVSGNTHLTTSNKKFGSASAVFDGSGDDIRAAASSDWLFTGAFTIRFYLYLTSAGYWFLCGRSSTDQFQLYTDSGGAVRWLVNGSNEVAAGGSLTLNAWHLIEIGRSGSTCYLFIDGTLIASGTASGNLGSSSEVFAFGMRPSDNWGCLPNGSMLDEAEIWNGTCLHTSSYTVPSAQTEDPEASWVQLAHGVDFSASRNDAGTQTTITNISGGSLTATFDVRK